MSQTCLRSSSWDLLGTDGDDDIDDVGQAQSTQAKDPTIPHPLPPSLGVLSTLCAPPKVGLSGLRGGISSPWPDAARKTGALGPQDGALGSIAHAPREGGMDGCLSARRPCRSMCPRPPMPPKGLKRTPPSKTPPSPRPSQRAPPRGRCCPVPSLWTRCRHLRRRLLWPTSFLAH